MAFQQCLHEKTTEKKISFWCMAVLILKVSHVETVPDSKQLLMFRMILRVARYDIFFR